jgi:NIPSNAP protein
VAISGAREVGIVIVVPIYSLPHVAITLGCELGAFPVVELRRYTIRAGKRERFARYFETFFPEAFEQLGAVVAGSFLERGDRLGFTWIRGFHDLDARAVVCSAFYDGPLWMEHRQTINDLLVDCDNVLLLHALTPARGIAVLPPVDPVTEENSPRGTLVAQVFTLQPGAVDSFVPMAEPVFARYRDAGVREAGVLVTLDVPNNFPRHAVRADGPHLVWLGMLQDDATLERRFLPLAERALPGLVGTGRLRARPEMLVLDPTRRSRLRWLSQEGP